MKICKVKLKSLGTYSQSKYIGVPKKDGENSPDYEDRTWRERCNADKEGNLFIPAMAFKNCIAAAAKFMAIPIPGKTRSLFTKHFLSGVLVLENMPLPATKDTVEGEWVFVPSDGKRGGGSRVHKCFPVVHEWEGTVVFHILDNTITEKVFRDVLDGAGSFIGVGRFRPENGGIYGRFTVEETTWEEVDV